MYYECMETIYQIISKKGKWILAVLQFFEKLCLYSNEKNEINTGILYISHGIENPKYCLKSQLSYIVIDWASELVS